MKTIIKKIITLMAVFSMILPIVSCANNEDYTGIDAQDFVLTIKADKEQYRIGEEILIDIALENKSEKNLKIAYYFLTYLQNPPINYPVFTEMPSETHKKFFKTNEAIRMTERLGGCYPLGEHEVNYRAIFYLGWDTEDSEIRVISNTIKLSIIEA